MTSTMQRRRAPWEAKQEAIQAAREKFWAACDRKDTDEIRELLRAGPLELEHAESYLWHLIDTKNFEVARWLFENGANPNKVSMYTLVESCTLDMLNVLVEGGWDIQSRGLELMVRRIDEREFVEGIISYGIDLNKPVKMHEYNSGGQERDDTNECLNEAAARGDIRMFDYFVSHGAIPSRSIALHKVCRCKDPALTTRMIVHLVEKYEFDINADDRCDGLRQFCGLGQGPPEWGTPFRCAMAYKNVAAIEAMLWYGADPNLILCTAIKADLIPAVRLLLEARGNAGDGAAVAVEYRRPESLRLCVEFGAKGEDYCHVSARTRILEYNNGEFYVERIRE